MQSMVAQQIAVSASQRPLHASEVHAPNLILSIPLENTRKTVYRSLRNNGHNLYVFVLVLKVNQH